MVEKRINLLESKLEFQEFKLNSLLEITNAINSNLPIDKLIEIFHFILKEQLHFSKILLLHQQQKWEILLKIGIKGSIVTDELIRVLSRSKEITTIDSSPDQLLSKFQTIVPVFHQKEPLAYLLLSENHFDELSSKEHLNNLRFIQTLANIIVVAIENKRMNLQNIKQVRLKKELEVASEMQKMLFPTSLPSNKQMDLSAKHTSRHQVGGDYYDFIPLNEDEFIFCIADVSGKGISAAMLMANFQATIRTLYSYQQFELDYLINELNKKVIQNAKGEKFITFFIAHYNQISRKLKYINAGHNAPILTNGKKIKLLDEGTVGLGMFDELPFINTGALYVDPNTTLVMYTDGVIELENEKNEYFEIERLIKLIHQYYPLKMEDLNSLIFSKLDEWKSNKNFDDDTAIFSCRFY
jgi:sigma-B regulation protein RsbU (phosphoserine phosphatase)